MFYWARTTIESQGCMLRICKVFWYQWNNLLKQWKVSSIFETECFLTCSMRLLRSNTLDQFILERMIGIQKSEGIVRKWKYLSDHWDWLMRPQRWDDINCFTQYENLGSFLNFKSFLKSVETFIVCEISSYIKFHK